MKGRNQEGQSAPTPAAPFFARFLESQHGADAGAQAAVSRRSLKYPSDRDEDDFHSPASAEAATTKAGPSRMTLKYPSDRDEDDFKYSS